MDNGKVAASGYPASRGQLVWLAAHGIGSILTLTPGSLPGEWLDGLPFEVEHLPMADHEVPRLEDLEKGAVFVQDAVKRGRPVLVHCLAGEGRTGCILGAYLIKDRMVAAAEALRTLRMIKPQFVEREQEEALFRYASTVPS